MKIEKFETIKVEIDKVREIYLMLKTVEERPFVDLYTAYKDFGTLCYEFGVFCDQFGPCDPEEFAINLAMSNHANGNLMWPELSDEDMELLEIESEEE